MVKLHEINRTSTFAWGSETLPLLATGTVAGAVDIDFSTSSKLEIWEVFKAGDRIEPLFTADVENKFFSIAWSQPLPGRPKGLLAGAFDNGLIEFWDIEVLLDTKDLVKASVHKSKKHSGAVKTLSFNPNQAHILVSGGSNGEIYVWDVNSFSEPTVPGQAMTPMDDITNVAWNNSVDHIFASTGNGGFTSIWDLKSKREVLHLSYSGETGKANFSCVSWHPTQSTKLVTASDSDSCSVILTWDLRNSNAPEKKMIAPKGVLSLDWCKQDPELLISSGKDNTTILWNPVKGIKLTTYPTTANWAFLTRFVPSEPGIFTTASFDGKIIIQSLQDTSPPIASKVEAKDDSEFWTKIATEETQHPVVEELQAPSWMKTPSAVSFGYGSKLVFVKTNANGKSEVTISNVISNENLAKSFSQLDSALESHSYDNIIETNIRNFIGSNDKLDWELLEELRKLGKEGLFDKVFSVSHLENESEDAPESNEVAENINEAEFFEKLGDKNEKSDLNESFCPSGEFSIFEGSDDDEKEIIKLLLEKNSDSAIEKCLKNGKLMDALVLALDSSDTIKQKVKNAYFNKKEDNLSRIVYCAAAKNATDIVANANVVDWREIATAIKSFSVDQNDFENKISELGDRILNSGSLVDESRKFALMCYIAGNSLNKISAVWADELNELEAELLASKDKISSPFDAKYFALSNFVEKLTTYRGLAKISSIFEGPLVEMLEKYILEYSTLVAGYGKFELAKKILSLLPSELNGIKAEKDRIDMALKKDTPKAQKLSQKPMINRVSSHNMASMAGAHNPVHAPDRLQAPSIVPSQPYVSNPTKFVRSPKTLHSRMPVSNPYIPSNNSAQPINPYKVSSPQNSYGMTNEPAAAPIAAPPKPNVKEETEGWNDLPNTFKSHAARRATPARRPSTPSTIVSSTPAVMSAPSKQGFAPPPKGASRTNSRASITAQPESIPNSPVPAFASSNNKYAPPGDVNSNVINAANSSPFAGVNMLSGSASTPVPKNPYAPTTTGVSHAVPKNPYAPQPAGKMNEGTAFSPAMGSESELNRDKPSTAKPVKNPYAPSSDPLHNGSPATVPMPRMGGIIPQPQAQFINQYQSGQVSVLPPPPKNLPSNSPIASQPPQSGGFVNLGPPTPKSATNEIHEETAFTGGVKALYPAGDRSHIPQDYLEIYNTFESVLVEVKPKISEKYARHGKDMEKRLGMLFDHLNNDDLLSQETINYLKSICKALKEKDYSTAAGLNIEIGTKHSEETLDWHTGVKRLIQMAEALL